MIYFRNDYSGAILFEAVKFERAPTLQIVACTTIDCDYGLIDAEDLIEPLDSWLKNCGGPVGLIGGSEVVHEEIDDFQAFLIKKLLHKASKN